jgi:flagellar biosynthesis protein
MAGEENQESRRATEEARARRREAIALKYEAANDEAPRVVASGKGLVADNIVAAAQAHGVPVQEDAPLANVLGQIEVGTEIPPALYRAVAELLAFVWRLNRRVAEHAPLISAVSPSPPDEPPPNAGTDEMQTRL